MPNQIVTRRQLLTAGSATAIAFGVSQLSGNGLFAQDKKQDADASSDFTSSIVNNLQERDPEAKSLGDSAYIWHGDDLPRRVGGPPSGYVTKTYMTKWTKGIDNPGYMSFGPYFEPAGTGSMLKVRWLMEFRRPGGANEDVLTVDYVDRNNGGRDLLPPTTFKVRQFPTNSAGFIIFSTRTFDINPRMSIETRVTAHGGGDLTLYQLRYDAYYL